MSEGNSCNDYPENQLFILYAFYFIIIEIII